MSGRSYRRVRLNTPRSAVGWTSLGEGASDDPERFESSTFGAGDSTFDGTFDGADAGAFAGGFAGISEGSINSAGRSRVACSRGSGMDGRSGVQPHPGGGQRNPS